jgi:hypothetical protein
MAAGLDFCNMGRRLWLNRVPGRSLAAEPFVMFQRAPGLVLHDLVLGFCH